MNPAQISVALMLVEQLTKESPTIAMEIGKMLNKAKTTPEEWAALKKRVLTPYKVLVPNSELPEDQEKPTEVVPAPAPIQSTVTSKPNVK